MILRTRAFRLGATLVVTGVAALYIVSKIDVSRTAHIIGSADPWWLALSLALTVGTVPPQAWRWQLLLRVRGVTESFVWLQRAYFVSYAVGQVLPTSVGGDASRIFETTRRHPGFGSPIAGSVLLERALGGAVTLALAALGFLLALGRYDIGAYLWVEALFVVLTALAGVVLFSRRARRLIRPTVPLLRRARVERPVRAVYEGIHGYRDHVSTLLVVAAVTALQQGCRIVAIWASAESVGIHLSLRPYVVLGPLLFLVMLVPFTVNGLAVREAFFVSFLGKLGVGADPAFATGFIFFVMTLLLSAPGLAIILWEGVRRAPASVPES
ncbi:MAG TPA: lysylphosphatidylglycerol synthase transmembrane domain-containing protein [Gaiellaceae bacterium]|nr:lysylphosphatidylglycerol synthase transmembrane domain-containing protein [Gaiellaceae bacterium]